MIQERIRQGVYVKDVTAELEVHPRTVSRALKRGGSAPGQRPAARKSKLDRYKPVIDRLLAAGVWNAAVILREIQEQGYSGQASIPRDYIRPKRPLRQARATVRFETAPGEQLQNDWAKYRTLLVEGARSAIVAAARKSDPRSRWITGLAAKRGPCVTAVAVANRNARICWALLARGEAYRPAAASGKLRVVPLRAAGKNTVG
jgi:hypothetical protein